MCKILVLFYFYWERQESEGIKPGRSLEGESCFIHTVACEELTHFYWARLSRECQNSNYSRKLFFMTLTCDQSDFSVCKVEDVLL